MSFQPYNLTEEISRHPEPDTPFFINNQKFKHLPPKISYLLKKF